MQQKYLIRLTNIINVLFEVNFNSYLNLKTEDADRWESRGKYISGTSWYALTYFVKWLVSDYAIQNMDPLFFNNYQKTSRGMWVLCKPLPRVSTTVHLCWKLLFQLMSYDRYAYYMKSDIHICTFDLTTVK
jgi:hypothetical protein